MRTYTLPEISSALRNLFPPAFVCWLYSPMKTICEMNAATCQAAYATCMM
jgi:hypothetical protein